jgi:radical SAM superfamily enzyme YgiQ (UPF0313 family)
MRVLMVFPDLARDVTNYTGVLSPAVALISGMLKDAGHQVELYHMYREPTEQEFRARIRGANADLVAFSINSHYRRRMVPWSRWAHEESGAPVAVGGVHATLAPAEMSAIPDVDYTCVGEGELAILELCDALENGRDTSRIQNFWVRTPDGIVKNNGRPLIQNLDDIPDPDYGIYDVDNLYHVKRGLFPYLMSRGCSFKCTYCSIPAMMEMSGERESSFWRFLSPERAVGQMRALMDAHMPYAERVHFLDAIFFSSKNWLKEFAVLYKEQIGLPFSCNLRADYVTKTTTAILKDMGCEVVRFGVESGDDEMNARVLLRGLSIDKIRRAFDMLAAAGIQRVSYNLVGLPEENLALSLKTVRLNAELEPDIAIPFIFYPYPGTALYEKCKQEGYLTDREYDNYFIGVTTDMPDFRASDILFVHRFFHRIMALYRVGKALPSPLDRWWMDTVDVVLRSPLFPRALLVRWREAYKALRQSIGERLVHRSPRLYRLLGGTGPA